ncbi:MAG: hypothetical protein KDN19_00405 [Verrucomicrobiae bacterium]|nr:hypothetical protein [Verrucomicrobiae bacterium]
MTTTRNSFRPWVIGLGLIAFGLATYLLIADTPWDAARETAERIEAGKRARPEADFVTGLWVAAAANLVVVLALLATVKVWLPRLALGPIAAEKGCLSPKTRLSSGFWFGLVALLLVGGFFRYPLASRSLWWDELWGIKFGIVGYYIGEEDQPVEDRYFAEANWRRALWYYTRPTNHPAASFPARISHVIWKSIADPEKPHAFSDFAVRFFNFLSSLGAVAGLALVGAAWGRPAGGLMAAFFLALHPWAIRYGVDLRGYSWVMLWTVAGFLWLAALFRSGKSRWWPWWGFGINQALLVWSFPHAAFVALGFFVAAFFLVFSGWKEKPERWAALGRLLLVNVAAGMLFLQLFAPNVLQMTRWYESVNANHTHHALGTELLRELAVDVVSGQPWRISPDERAQGYADLASLGPWLWPVLVVLGLTALWGAISLCRKNRVALVSVACVVGAGALLLVVFRLTGTFFYTRFAIFLLIPFVLLLGMAFEPAKGNKKWLPALLMILPLVAFFDATWKERSNLRSRPFCPMHEVADRMAAIESESQTPVIFACYGHSREMMPLYAPEVRGAVSLGQLEALASEAKTNGARLFVAYGYPAFNRAEVPDGFTWLDDASRFAEVASWQGIDPDSGFTLLEWRGEKARE